MTQMLVTLVDEAQSLPANVVDIIVAQFLRAATPGGGKGKQEVDGKQNQEETEPISKKEK